MKPPIEKDGTIVVRDALYFVADIIHPSERYRNKSKCDVRKSVLSAIRTAYKQHVFGQVSYRAATPGGIGKPVEGFNAALSGEV